VALAPGERFRKTVRLAPAMPDSVPAANPRSGKVGSIVATRRESLWTSCPGAEAARLPSYTLRDGGLIMLQKNSVLRPFSLSPKETPRRELENAFHSARECIGVSNCQHGLPLPATCARPSPAASTTPARRPPATAPHSSAPETAGRGTAPNSQPYQPTSLPS
jgi:hypothetical protein